MIFGPEESTVVAAPPRRAPARTLRTFMAPALLGSRVIIPTTDAAGAYGVFGRTVGWFAADPAYGNRFTTTGKELLLARNTSGAPLCVSVRGAPDANTGRVADQTLTIEAGDVATFGPFPYNGWRQSDGYVWVDAASSGIQFSVITGLS